MHIKINFTKIFQSFVLLSGLSLAVAFSLPNVAGAQANNPFTQTPTQQQVNNSQVDQAVQQKIGSVTSADKNAAQSQYCRAYFVSWDLSRTPYEKSDLKACVDGVVQKVAGVDASDSCMNYHATTAIGKENTNLYQICKNAFSATPKNSSTATLIGGHNANTVKQNAKNASQAAANASSSGSTDEDQVNCDANESPLSWIACPLIDAGAGMTDYIFNNFVQPLLENVPISADSKDGSFLAWQTFRIFGNAILVGSLLVMVFAQNFGRFVDAYTIRKMAPRIVVGAIAINISFYLCLAAIDIVNVIGNGLHQALTAPFIDENTFKEGIPIDASAANNITGVLGAGLLVAGAGVIFGTVATIGALGIISLMLPLIISVALVSLAVLFTIIIRQALLIFLTAISAVAIACFILPGTEKYFRQWWDLFLKTLMVYPIIAIIFAMSNIMASIILRSAGGGVLGTAQVITAILAVYAPLVLIPFAFKFAGGAIGNLMDLASKRAQGLSARTSEAGMLKRRREQAKMDFGNVTTQRRAAWADSLKGLGTEKEGQGAFRRHVGNRAFRAAAGATGGYNIEAVASARRAETAKIMEAQKATGRDEEIVGLATDKRRIDALRRQNIGEGEEWQYGSDGQLQYRSLNGTWVDEAHVAAGHARWGNDEYAQQYALSYAMQKSDTTEKAARLKAGYESLSTGQWGMSKGVATGVLKGAGFENQGQHLQFKHMNLDGSVDHDAMVQEIYENKGAYSLAQMSSDNMQELVYASENQNLSQDTKDRLASISETFMNDYRTGGGVVGEADGVPQQMQGQPVAGGDQRMFNSSGSGSVNEKLLQLAKNTDRYTNAPDPNRPYQRPDAPQK